jgi:phage tail sheath protein FI
MAQLKFGSAGVTTREIDLSGPTTSPPSGIPAGVIGTSLKGPAFVPITVGNLDDWYAKFGRADGKKFGPLAAVEWLRNARSLTYLKVLGVGDGRKRLTTSKTVQGGGFTVGDKLFDSNGYVANNPNANSPTPAGRTYFLGCFMSESAGSTFFSDAGLQGSNSVTPDVASALPIIRGVLMAPSGVILRLSCSYGPASAAPSSTLVPTETTASGSTIGDVVLSRDGSPKQDFVMLLNGHKGTDAYPNFITASFNVNDKNYFYNALNRDPMRIQEAGHYLYANWDVHPLLASVTGSGLVNTSLGADVKGGKEPAAFIITGSSARDDSSNLAAPNYENFRDRFSHAKTPWIVSQKFGGKAVNLFRLHALDDGANIANSVKVSIENIVVSSDPANKFGSFTVVLRYWNEKDRDTNKLPIANEVFAGVNLDPSSDRYIGKVIGDTYAYYDFDREESEQKLVIEGNYPNRSNYVRVEIDPSVENGFTDPTALPVGFRGIDHLVTSGSAPLANLHTGSVAFSMLTSTDVTKRAVTPPLPLRTKITNGEVDSSSEIVESNLYWGTLFEHPYSLTRLNEGTVMNVGVKSFSTFFPNWGQYGSGYASFITGSNNGQPDTANWGVIDADRFCNNGFSLENIQVTTGSNGLADPQKWLEAVYVRNGKISVDEANATRALKVEDITTSNRKFAKFSLFMQGGFDGVNIFDKDSVELNNAAVTAEMDAGANRGLQEGPAVRTYLKALDVMKNTVNVDIQLLAIPGIRQEIVTDAALLATQERFDALYVMDIEQKDENDDAVTSSTQIPSVTNTVAAFKDRSVDNSFGAAYFPDVLYKTPSGVNLFVPPSVVVLGALALNDAVGHPWFAPAGFARGALPQEALEPRTRLQQDDMDLLYDNSINPIVAFPGAARSGTNPRGGIVVWGQKTLQVAASALDRVNVRRLLIEIRRQVRDIAQTILFEPNREATLAKFSAAVTPRLARIQALSGLERFKVIIDSSTTTQDDIENNTVRGKIFVQPTKSIEFVSIDFVVANNLTQVQ